MRNRSLTDRACRLLALCAIGAAFVSQHRSMAASDSDFFKEKVAPILEQNCVMCHGARVQRSGLDLRGETSILKGGARGPAVVPGDAENSLLYRLISHKQEPAMPMGMDKLGDAEVAVIAQWINGLAPKAAMAAETIPTRQPGYSITEKDRQFWSFIKPVRPALPKTKDRRWARNEIDSFVLSKLEQNGLKPNPAASPRELLRRVYFDLIGLPPSPEETAEFLKNPSEAAYAKVVDRLLASPHYGERWGRHWLDLARYADSGGYEFDYDRPHAWRYRDYVIKSFNEDKPYNRFIIEQLAADQFDDSVAEVKPEALIPTGFVRNGPTVDNADNEETRMDELDDMVTTTSAVFLGLTVGCARCHDHKYDPIPQRDYYRMQAIFFPFQKTEAVMVSKEEEAALKARNKEIDDLARPYMQKIAEIEKPARERLLNEKVEFHVQLAEMSSGFEGKTKEQYREETAKRFARDVKLQNEEIEALLSPEDLKARKEIQNEIDKINMTRPKPPTAAMGVTDKRDPGQAYLLKRGDWRNKGEEVQPGLPQVLAGDANLDPKNRRRQLAEWIASADNPLTARVAVNRIWQYHFGKGLVRTPSDFGATGDRPSHPELLDWLAVEFMRPTRNANDSVTGRRGDGANPQSAIRNPQLNALQSAGWRWKAMHRLILLSNTYRQSSQFNEQASAKDPENRLLWRMNPRRLEAEPLRDGILAVSGKLNREMFGPGIFPRIDPDVINTGSRPRWPLDAKDDQSTWRRSVYIFVKRSVLLPLIEVFDCPATVVSGPTRAVSTVSPQALALMNNEFVLQQAFFFAERVAKEAGADKRAQVVRAFEIALNRPPNAKEIEWSLSFLKSQAEGFARRKDEKPEESALRDFCHAIINLNEFVYVD
ncbi:MAG TPA: PSD1 and planctomycete cytochrome C domain-containing protein [Blastocatellia bacterium]|nr:PSD1 and planctomycete cytochrome C domain-containing protein [Blastocatellia bacterium]